MGMPDFASEEFNLDPEGKWRGAQGIRSDGINKGIDDITPQEWDSLRNNPQYNEALDKHLEKVSEQPEIDAHYTKLKIQPMYYSMENNLDPMQATIIKYVTRFRDKGGKRDLLAALKTLDMLIKYEYEK